MSKLSQYPFGEFGKQLHKWREGALFLWRNLYKFRDISQSNFDLGKKHYGLGNFEDAILRFKFVTWLEPKQANAWYWLGISHIAAGQKNAAIKSLKKSLAINPDMQVARDALAQASQNA